MRASRLGLVKRLEVGLHADVEEEHRDEQVAHRRELAPDPGGGGRATERDARGERTDDRSGEVGDVGRARRTPA